MTNHKSEDFTIVGSGAGGSTAALSLLENGYSINIFEEGEKFDRDKINLSKFDFLSKYWRYNGVTPIFGKPFLSYGEGVALGGSTVINGGVITAIRDNLLMKWADQVDKHIFDEKLYFSNCKNIENNLLVRQQYKNFEIASASSQVLVDAAIEKNFKTRKINRALINCKNHNNCPFGCTSGAKQSLDLNYHKKILKLGGQINSNKKVLKIEVENDRASKLIIFDKIKNKTFEKKINNLILACGPTQTPKLLLKNKIIKKCSPLEFNLNFKVLASYKNDMGGNQSTLLTHHINEFENDGAIFMTSNYIKPVIASYLENFKSSEIKDYINKLSNSLVFNCQFQPSFSNGLIKYSPLFRDLNLTWNLHDNDYLKIRKYLAILVELIFSSGAETIILPFNKGIKCKNFAQANNIINNTEKEMIELNSVHGMSSCQLSKEDIIINKNAKLNDFKNIFIMDASIIPSNTGQHPQLTIMSIIKTIINNNIEQKIFA